MNFKQVIFEGDIKKSKSKVEALFNNERYSFIDREYEGEHRIRLRGIIGEVDKIYSILGDKKDYFLKEEDGNEFFENIEQFILYCTIHHTIDDKWFNHYFVNTVKLKNVINFCKGMAESLTIQRDEGYNSHFSHFWGFFHTLTSYQKKGILEIFKRRYENIKITKEASGIDIEMFLKIIDQMISEEKINFYSPLTIDKLIIKRQFSSKLHEHTMKDAVNASFYKSKHYIFNRWYLNALYITFMLMNIPVIDKYFINYVIAMEKYPINEICELYLKTGEEKLWLKKIFV